MRFMTCFLTVILAAQGCKSEPPSSLKSNSDRPVLQPPLLPPPQSSKQWLCSSAQGDRVSVDLVRIGSGTGKFFVHVQTIADLTNAGANQDVLSGTMFHEVVTRDVAAAAASAAQDFDRDRPILSGTEQYGSALLLLPADRSKSMLLQITRPQDGQAASGKIVLSSPENGQSTIVLTCRNPQ